MEQFDFLFVYQIKQRELENIILLKKELERRGYSVAIEPFWRCKHRTYRIPAKVVAGQIDDNWQMMEMRLIADNPQKYINFKWEQIYSNSAAESKDTAMVIRGQAQKILTLAWGDNSIDHFTRVYGVPRENLVKTGHLTMDFLRPEFRSFYKGREELAKEFSLDPKKKWYLYISSFTSNALTKEDFEGWRHQHSGSKDLYAKKRFSEQSQRMTLDWIEKALQDHPDYEFIYRPHPVERDNPIILDLEKRCPQFHAISAYSVKPWILACDKIYTWYSTSIGEIYCAGRSCSIIRPLPIAFEEDPEVYRHAAVISDQETFEREFAVIHEGASAFPIPAEDMERFYYVTEDSYVFERVADAFEMVLHDDRFIVEAPMEDVPLESSMPARVKNGIRRFTGASRICMALSHTKVLQKTN